MPALPPTQSVGRRSSRAGQHTGRAHAAAPLHWPTPCPKVTRPRHSCRVQFGRDWPEASRPALSESELVILHADRSLADYCSTLSGAEAGRCREVHRYMMEELRARGKACEGERATSSTDGPACAEMYGYQQLMRDVAAAGSGADLYRVVALHQKFGQQKQQAVAAGGGGGVNNAGAAVAPPHSREQAAPPELVAKARQAFAKMDYDHDGYIDTDAFNAAMRQLGFALSGADAAVDLEALGVTQDGEHPGRPGRLDLQQFLDIVDVHGLSHAGEKGAEAEFLRHVTRTGDCGWWGEAPTSVENAP